MGRELSDSRQWYAVRTKFRAEKLAKRLLEQKSLEVYLPLRAYSRQYSRKVKHYQVPLLSCFIFVRMSRMDYIQVIETPYVHGLVKIGSEIMPVKEDEINILRRIEGSDLEVSMTEEHLDVGLEVYINQGTLFGLRGRITSIHSKEKLVVSMESMPFALLIEVERKTVTVLTTDKKLVA